MRRPWWRHTPGPLPDRPDCGQVERAVQSFLDGELRPADARLVAVHLRECERCGREAELVREIMATIRRQRLDPLAAPLARLTGFVDDLATPSRSPGAGP